MEKVGVVDNRAIANWHVQMAITGKLDESSPETLLEVQTDIPVQLPDSRACCTAS